jgi:DNA-binding protein Fis
MKDNDTEIAKAVYQLTVHYMKTAGEVPAASLLSGVLDQIVPVMLELVIKHYGPNQSQIARILGISRGKCRFLLIKYFGHRYARSRDKSLK